MLLTTGSGTTITIRFFLLLTLGNNSRFTFSGRKELSVKTYLGKYLGINVWYVESIFCSSYFEHDDFFKITRVYCENIGDLVDSINSEITRVLD